MSRTDDVINTPATGSRLGPWKKCCPATRTWPSAIVGVADEYKGQVPLGFAVLKAGVDRDPAEISAELVALVRERIGPVALFKNAWIVSALPKTRSGKILRSTIRKMADGDRWSIPPTIEDVRPLEQISGQLEEVGYPVSAPAS